MRNHQSNPTITNCTFADNSARDDGGGIRNGGDSSSSSPVIINSIFWNNSDDSDGFSGGPFFDESAQIFTQLGTPVVDFSCVQGGWTGAGGTGNIAADPLFVDVMNDDVRLLPGSPCFNAGSNAAADLPVYDLDGGSRIQECIVDMGAYELPPTTPSIPADRDCDGDVDGVDFGIFASCFNQAGNPPRTLGCIPEQQQELDFDHDGDIDGVDFGVFASCFNKAGNPPRTGGCPPY
jgi:predicted outer membrane repeat protein